MRLAAALCLVVSASAAAQRHLVLVGVPPQFPAGPSAGPLTVNAVQGDGGIDATVSGAVNLAAMGPAPQLCDVRATWNTCWNPQLTVAMSAGMSDPFFLRNGLPGSVTLNATAAGLMGASATMQVTALELDDDFEDGAPDWILDSPRTVLVPDAGHRGAYGLRSVDTDTTTMGPGVVTRAVRLLAVYEPDFYYRVWMRASASGESAVLKLERGAGGIWALDLAPDGNLGIEMISFDGGFFFDGTTDAGAGFVWRLLEFEVHGSGTPDASVAAYVDGERRLELSGIDQHTLGGDLFSLGAFYENDQRDTLATDFDDSRFSAAPPAERLTLTVDAGGDCLGAAAGLVDLHGDVTPAPYDLALELEGGLSVSAYSDAQCRQPLAPMLARGTTQVGFFLGAADGGDVQVTVRHIDFLPGSAQASFGIALRPPPLQSARALDVACGCEAVPSAGALAVLALLISRRRSLKP